MSIIRPERSKRLVELEAAWLGGRVLQIRSELARYEPLIERCPCGREPKLAQRVALEFMERLNRIQIEIDSSELGVPGPVEVKPQSGYRWYHLCSPHEPAAESPRDVQDQLLFAVDSAADVLRVGYSGRMLDPGVACWVVYLTWLMMDADAHVVAPVRSTIQTLPARTSLRPVHGRFEVTDQLAAREPEDPDAQTFGVQMRRPPEIRVMPAVTLIEWLELSERAFALRSSFQPHTPPSAPPSSASTTPASANKSRRSGSRPMPTGGSAQAGRPREYDEASDEELVRSYQKSGQKPAEFAQQQEIEVAFLKSAQARVRRRKNANKSRRPRTN